MNKIFSFLSNFSKKGIFTFKGRREAKLKSIFGDDKFYYEKIIALSELHNSGQVYLLSLSNLKQGLGSGWNKLYSNIINNFTNKVKDRIGENNFFYPRSEEEFIVIFSEKNELATRHICIDILKSLSEIYLGNSDIENIDLKTATGKLNGKLLFKPVSIGENTADKAPVISPHQAVQKINKSKQIASKKQPYELVYRPIWDRKKELVSTYMVNARRKGDINYNNENQDTTPIGYHTLSNPFNLNSREEMDKFMMKETISVMNDFFQNNFRAVFSIPIHFLSLFNLTRLNEFLIQCQSIPKPLRKYISFTLTGFPTGFPEARMNFIITSLLDFSRNVVINCDKIPKNISYFKNNKISGVCLTIPNKIDDPALYWQKINRLSTHCHKEQISLFLDGINQSKDLKPKNETDLDFIAGNIIGSYSDVPAHVSHMDWDDIASN